MRIATWNINGLRARLDFILHWLSSRQPDVVGLQELKLTDELFPYEVFEAAGYTAITHGQKAWNGVAVLGRIPITEIQQGLPGQAQLGARLLTVHAGDFDFTTVYCPNGKNLEHPDYQRKLDWFKSLAQHWSEYHSPHSNSVLCGDLNICPAPIDSWDEERLHGHIFHTSPERNRFRALLNLGLHDLFRNHYPDTQEFSWWDYRGGSFHRGIGLRIDFLLATQAVLDRVISVKIDREYRKKKDGMTPSDHAPVIADLQQA